MKLSAVVLTQNSAAVIEDCLRSLRFCDEIIVVDSGSIDSTLALAPTARIFKRKLVSFAAQRNFGLKQAIHPWVLMIDSDERVSAKLAKEINYLPLVTLSCSTLQNVWNEIGNPANSKKYKEIYATTKDSIQKSKDRLKNELDKIKGPWDLNEK